ncbi:MAG: hypothetical protein IPG45_20010 [Deltaproteobacteria bacterium]|jgi:hypothetical protein|nr:hypothetical protein [Deltaproteobacteria bacterium]
MPGTPPRLSATIPPAPLTRIRLGAIPNSPRRAPVDLLALGRGLDASLRSDADYFLSVPELEAQPAVSLGAQLAAFCRPAEDELGGLAACLESFDPADLSAGLDRLRTMLAERPTFAAALLQELRGDPGLEDRSVAAILGYGALEQYYRAQASHSAKRRFDAHRTLIEVATHSELNTIQAEAPIGGGLRVWEGWQAITALAGIFGLGAIIEVIERKSETITLGLVIGADLLLKTHARAERDEIEAALANLWSYAKDRRQARDLGPLTRAKENLFGPVPAFEEVRSEAATDPNLLPSRPLPRTLRTTLLERGDLDSEHQTPRTVAAFIEELASVLERYEVLIVGDDNSLMFEVAPILYQSFLSLYRAFALQHPLLEQGLYEGAEADNRHRREVLALRVLVGRATNLERRFLQLLESTQTPGVSVRGAHQPPPPEPEAPPPTSVTEAQAEALLLVLTARGLDPSPPLVAAIKRGADPATFRRWLARAAVATTLTEVFSEPAPAEEDEPQER